MKSKVVVILGQTATGKSDLAVRIARKIGGEVISADSRQVYKNLDIGTGKITFREMRDVPHHLLDIADPKKQFTVAEYKKLALEKITEIVERGKIPIICGGTGFYIDAIVNGTIFPNVAPNDKLRIKLIGKSVIQLFLILKKLDQRRAKNIDSKNKVRLIRAIEIAKTLGKVPQIKEVKPMYKFIKVGLYLSPDKLRKKVEKRVKKMFRDGLKNEIKKMKKSGISQKRLKGFGFEYFNPTPEKIVRETLKYTKRRMTWFKRDKEIKWFSNSSSVLAWLQKSLAK